jgi:N-acetylmuramoyl-L-alanine amidase
MAWFTEALKRPISHNFKTGGMIRPLHGLVLHIEEGTEAGTRGWFNMSVEDRQTALDAAWRKGGSIGPQPKAYASSAHFGNPKTGLLEQFVDTANMAYAQMAGNAQWISVENEGHTGDSLTASQINNVAALLGWLRWNEVVPLQLADNPAAFGLGYHGMGGKAWGGHDQCPGKPIINQRLLIIERAGFWRPPSSGILV